MSTTATTNAASTNTRFQVVHRGLDEASPGGTGRWFADDPGRQRSLDGLEASLDLAVSATVSAPGCFEHRHYDGRPALVSRIAPLYPRREIHRRDLTQEHRLTTAISHRPYRAGLPGAWSVRLADQVFAVVLIDESARGIGAELRHRPSICS